MANVVRLRLNADDKMVTIPINTHTIEPGDKIKACGEVVTVAEIISCDWYDPEGFFCEFKDQYGRYRYWKQYLDGGYVIKKEG